jgi:large subunit ribosomal protein L21
MYAVFEDGSRQYGVEEGDVVRLDWREAEVGDEVEFGRVLLLKTDSNLSLGRPLVEGARVVGEVVSLLSEKVYIQKFRRRKNSKRLKGHRQHYLGVRILEILPPGAERKAPEEEEEQEQQEAPAQS